MPVPRRRRAWLVPLAIAPVLLATACSGSDSGSDSGSGAGSSPSAAACAPTGGKVALQFWTWVPGMDKVVAKWNAANPDIQVTVKNTPAGNAGTYQNMFNSLKAGTAPDLGQVEYDTLSSFRLQEGLKDISGCPGVSDAKPTFVDWAWKQAEVGGPGVYAIPQDTGPMAMFYRKDIFEQNGITPPTTWDEYAAAGEKLKAKGILITHFPQQDANWFDGLLWQAGAQIFETSGDSVKVALDDPQAVKVAEYWQKLIDAKLIATNLQGFSPELYKSWNDGKVASWISAAWGYSTIRDNAKDTAGKWAVAPMPQWAAGEKKAGNWGGSTTAVMSGSKHPAEAAKFALWLNSDTEALSLANELGGLYPANTAGLDLPALTAGVPFYGDQKVFDVFKEASANVDTNFQWGPIMTDTNRFLSDGFTKALNGQGTLQESLTTAQTQTKAALKSQGIKVAE
ncbi:MAG TPA: sugar ABC transporter substrate-binding protein [Dermatophilaceae bacterium]|nr:sugar ABC transporter substrate-binding protein [Dermatophilaceae bacterium]